MQKKLPLFTVVTVCFNAETLIKDTIESVKNQTFRDYEYIIMDGKSTDHTVQIAEGMKDDFSKIGVDFRIASEKDSGIYNAMNKAIKMASGEWIVFINCGDQLYSEKVFEEVSRFASESEYEIVVGDIVIQKNGLYMYKALQFVNLQNPIDICHQSTYTRTEWLKKRPYDESYRLAADRDFFCWACREGARVGVLRRPLSIYLEGGVSAGDRGRTEISEVNKKYGVPETQQVIKVPKVKCLYPKKLIHRLLPEWVKLKRKQRQMVKNGWSKQLPKEKESM